MVDRERAMKLAGDLAVSYPGRTVSEEHAVRWAREFVEMTEYEARQVVESITSRAIDPPSRAQLRQVLDEVRGKTMSPAFDTSLCVFMDGVECRNCGEIHGHPLTPGEVLHGAHHLRRHLGGEADQFEAAQHPESCICAFRETEGYQQALERLGEAVLPR